MVKNLVMTVLILSSIFSKSVKAEDVISLEKDQKAPFSGVLFSPEKANEVKRKILERDLYKELSESQDRTISLYKSNSELADKKLDLLTTQNDKLAVALKDAQGMNTLERVALFALGVLATVGAGIAITRLAR
jgi:hypothetical protein